jgi:hypothetical protein
MDVSGTEGFCPGVHGIQEQNTVLEFFIEEAKLKKANINLGQFEL